MIVLTIINELIKLFNESIQFIAKIKAQWKQQRILPDKKESTERRRCLRFQYFKKVTLRIGDNIINAITQNANDFGLCIQSDILIEQGLLVKVEIEPSLKQLKNYKLP